MQLPLFGFCDGDLYLFTDIEEARSKIEPIDAKASRWRVYDRNGLRLTLKFTRRAIAGWWPLSMLQVESVDLLEGSEIAQKAMADDLRSFLGTVQCHITNVHNDWIKKASLGELVELAIAKFKGS
jgi:hypothetical protein